ncbi:mannose-1-phosphate guanylyltransferase/mannose-6-phosphate isomerase [Halomonas sediminis]
MIQPVILSGGSGTRLWPLSRRDYPKQFLRLTGESSLLQLTLVRLDGLHTLPAIVIGNQAHRFLLAEQLRETGHAARIMLEPEGRNTAPAIGCAAWFALQGGDDPLLLVLPADHQIRDTAAFHASLKAAQPLAEAGYLVTFGVVPERAETGYGYLKCGAVMGKGYELECFVEKPDLSRAEAYLEEGGYLWNGGIYMFRASIYLNALQRLQPGMHRACEQAVALAEEDLDFLRLDSQTFCQNPSDSIDYAVMEPLASIEGTEGVKGAAVVPLDAGWSDIGSFTALWEVSDKNDLGNATEGNVWTVDSRNLLVRAEHRLVATLGLDDLVIIETSDCVLVARRDQGQQIKTLMTGLEQAGREEASRSAQVHRPWGSFTAVDRGQRYQVKHISVAPGGRLSLQRHHHRAEHWVVVSGTAKVTLGETTFLVSENQSTYIPIGEVHRLENPGKIALELIEVQSGAYLGEDDIQRLDDAYTRLNDK